MNYYIVVDEINQGSNSYSQLASTIKKRIKSQAGRPIRAPPKILSTNLFNLQICCIPKKIQLKEPNVPLKPSSLLRFTVHANKNICETTISEQLRINSRKELNLLTTSR